MGTVDFVTDASPKMLLRISAFIGVIQSQVEFDLMVTARQSLMAK